MLEVGGAANLLATLGQRPCQTGSVVKLVNYPVKLVEWSLVGVWVQEPRRSLGAGAWSDSGCRRRQVDSNFILTRRFLLNSR